ncbi:MAG TPA: translation initiation factor IF-2 [Candidatus Omnitrophota bacterium]|nr:translation initiation factor IF-2 [Candidatus Omnitrophota bacterium]HPT06768.1 translation initiation factor IF-2 [Candidatus Omnitrophota bacterium]
MVKKTEKVSTKKDDGKKKSAVKPAVKKPAVKKTAKPAHEKPLVKKAVHPKTASAPKVVHKTAEKTKEHVFKSEPVAHIKPVTEVKHHAAVPTTEGVKLAAPGIEKPVVTPKPAASVVYTRPDDQIRVSHAPVVPVQKPAIIPASPMKPPVAPAKPVIPQPPVVKKHPVPPVQKQATVPVVESKPVVIAPLVFRELELTLPITLKDLSVKMQEKPSALIKALMDMRIMTSINQVLDEQQVQVVCQKFGFTIKKAVTQEESVIAHHDESDKPEDLKPRPPIVTFMGHVDHGKTSLLDAIRKTKVAEGEHGGITQHIGAYLVRLPHGVITFLDTPGHEAFTAMRARGASLTDIVVLVVAADDGVMPQTKEAIDHAKAAGVTIVVALNKIDKPGANVDIVKKQLSQLGLMSEDWGGKTIMVPVSAKTGQGIDDLLEMLILEAQMLELKANPNKIAKGVVVEAKMSKGRGTVATLLVQNGTLALGDTIVVGSTYGRIRAMFNYVGQHVKTAGPAFPVEVLGLNGVPQAGEVFYVIEDEKLAKEIVEKRQEFDRQESMKSFKRVSLEDLHNQILTGKIKELKLIVKSDVQGSLEAIKDTIEKLNISEVKIEIIHEGVGNINSSDVILAVASNALILGFNVEADDLAKELINKEGVDVKIYNIIYELANDIKAAVEGMLEPKLKKIFLGRVDVKKVFRLSRGGTIAGCMVSKGKITRNAPVVLLRNGTSVWEGTISSLKRFKDDVKDVQEGFECGISLHGHDDIQEGDVIEAHEVQKILRKLE